MHYLDEGPKDAPVMLCVHGNPTWSFYWRELVRAFSDRFRVIVPDHIGCGFSDKPQKWTYRLADHVENLTTLVETLNLQNITLVVHDWGGAIGMGVATAQSKRFSHLVVTNTAAFLSQKIPFSIASVKIPIFGTFAVRGLNGFSRIAAIRAPKNKLSAVAKKGLLLPYNSWANRIATLRFVEDIPLRKSHPSYSTLEKIDLSLQTLSNKPMLICWGDHDFCFTPAFRKIWQERFPEAKVHAWSDVGHYIMEDAPKRVITAMENFLF